MREMGFWGRDRGHVLRRNALGDETTGKVETLPKRGQRGRERG